MCHMTSIREIMGIISNYMIINYLNCLLKAATPLKVSSGRQAAVNFDVSPYHRQNLCGCNK